MLTLYNGILWLPGGYKRKNKRNSGTFALPEERCKNVKCNRTVNGNYNGI
jgi:hypothetical protein